MTYPLDVRATQEKAVATQTAAIDKLRADAAAATDPAVRAKAEQGAAAAEKARATAQAQLKTLGDSRTSIVGLEKPLIQLRNPGLISIPIGFLAVLIGSLLYRDRRAEEMWDELYVRSNTGIGRAAAAAH